MGLLDIVNAVDFRFPFLSAAFPFPLGFTDELSSVSRGVVVASSSLDLRPYARGVVPSTLFRFFDEVDESSGLSSLSVGELARFLPWRSPEDPSEELQIGSVLI